MIESHHIFFSGFKKMCPITVNLCVEHHRGTNGVHGMNGHYLDLELKCAAQTKLREDGMSDEEIREFTKGRLYI